MPIRLNMPICPNRSPKRCRPFTSFLIDEPPNFLKESAGRKKNRPASVLLCQGGGITEPTRTLGSARRIGDWRAPTLIHIHGAMFAKWLLLYICLLTPLP